jgi:transposase
MSQKKVKQRKNLATLERVHPNAGALDIGALEIWAAVPPERTAESVRRFGTFTVELEALADWLIEYGVDTVAMESTGVYWIPVFELLEARGLKVYLVNARHIKNVAGRKSDFLDCQSPKGRRSALAATTP